jgi:hypothetical protein
LLLPLIGEVDRIHRQLQLLVDLVEGREIDVNRGAKLITVFIVANGVGGPAAI